VIGGGYGIGRASALLLARAGANVALVDLLPERVEAVQKEVEALGVRATSLTGDVTDKAKAQEVVARAADFHGGLEVLINMVGMAAWTDLLGLEDDTWELEMARNLKHHLYVGKAAARQMIDRGTGGRMAFVASVSGIYGAPRHAAYGAAKAGVMSLVRTMSQEWAPHQIRVNAVAPDVIATPRVRAMYEERGWPIEESGRRANVPLGRFGQPEEIASALVFLVSDLASFITGQTLIVDGGVNAMFRQTPNIP
jgi:NAD(P)-dependent dehydrogenase (short-subunit alcohol dehydrogenase family)